MITKAPWAMWECLCVDEPWTRMREGARAQQQQDAGTDRCSGVVRAQHPYQIASDAGH